MWPSLNLWEPEKDQQGRGNSAQRTVEDNRIFLSTSLTMEPTRFPPTRGGGGEPVWKWHRWRPATTLRKEGPWAALTQRASKARPAGCQRHAGLVKPSFCDKGNASLQWLLLCRLQPECWEHRVWGIRVPRELRSCLGMGLETVTDQGGSLD